MASEPRTENGNRVRNAGVRMALKLLPDDMLSEAPRHLEAYLQEQLRQVEPETGEAGACYLMAPQADGSLKIMIVTLDESSAVRRVVRTTTLDDIFRSILEVMRQL